MAGPELPAELPVETTSMDTGDTGASLRGASGMRPAGDSLTGSPTGLGVRCHLVCDNFA